MKKSTFWLAAIVSIVPCFNCAIAKESARHLNDTKTFRQTITDAILKYEHTQLDKWSFQVARYNNEEGKITSSIAHFLPVNDGASRWHLVEINERMPSLEEQKAFAKKNKNNIIQNLVPKNALYDIQYPCCCALSKIFSKIGQILISRV